MKTILLSLLMAVSLNSLAQGKDRWTVTLNSLQLLLVNTEDTAANVVQAKKLKKGSLIITFMPGQVEGERKRKLMVYDDADNLLLSKEEHTLVIPVATLKKWRQTLPRIKIYTVPNLGEEGAAVRLRRMHLCTVNL